MYRFAKRVRCAYIFFIEIIEIIEILSFPKKVDSFQA